MIAVYIPGLDGSGPDHWQTLWRKADPTARLIQPSSWNHPILEDWMTALDREILTGRPSILVAHSLGCLLSIHWCATRTTSIAGAFLVAPPDPQSVRFPKPLAPSFGDAPRVPMRVQTLIVSSANDPYASDAYAEGLAKDLRARHWRAGPLGHINADSGAGEWPAGKEMLRAFRASLAA